MDSSTQCRGDVSAGGWISVAETACTVCGGRSLHRRGGKRSARRLRTSSRAVRAARARAPPEAGRSSSRIEDTGCDASRSHRSAGGSSASVRTVRLAPREERNSRSTSNPAARSSIGKVSGKYREHVGFPVAHGDHASIGTGLGPFRGTVQTRQPACALRGLRLLRRRRPEAGIHFQHAQRSPRRRDGQREMHGQTLHARSAASPFRQPLAGRQPRIVQHGGVLHRQHHRFQTAAIHRGLAMRVQHMLLRDTRIRQQAIGSLLLCRGGQHLRQGQARTIGPGAPHVHQPPPPRIAQRACALFPIGPVRLYRPMPGSAPHWQPSPGFRTQPSSPMPRQRMHPDRLRRCPAPARRTTGGAPRATPPARRPIARPGAGRIHVSIFQKRCRAMRSKPLRREHLRCLREHMGSQVRYPYPRKNQKSRLPNHRLQMRDTRGFRPADPAIPTGLVPARRRPSLPRLVVRFLY